MALWIELVNQTTNLDEVNWNYVQHSADGGFVQRTIGKINDFPKDDEIFAIIPSNKIAWQQLNLPVNIKKTKQAKLLQIIQSLLENKLLDEVESTHFVLQPEQFYSLEDNQLWIGLCNKTWLSEQLTFLAQYDIFPKRIVPQTYPTNHPNNNNYWLINNSEQAQLIICCEQGVFNQPFNPNEVLTPIVNITQDSVIYSSANLAEQLTTNSNFKVQLINEQLLANYLQQNPWNFAQFDFVTRKNKDYIQKISQAINQFIYAPIYKYLRLGLLILGLGFIIGINAVALKEKSTQKNLKQQINQNLLKAFPNTPLTKNPATTMHNLVRNLRNEYGTTSPDDIVNLLNLSAILLTNNSIIDISYAKYKLNLTLQNKPDATSQQQMIQQAKLYNYKATFANEKLTLQKDY